MRLPLILVLGLCLISDQCHGFEDLSLREICKVCRKLPNTESAKNCNCPARNRPSMASSESGTFSCSKCAPGSMYEPYLCDSCYRGKEEKEQFHCNTCKIGPSKAKKFICDKCVANPNYVHCDTVPENAELLYTDSQFEYYKVTVAKGTRMISGAVTDTCRAACMEAVCVCTAGGGCWHYNKDMCIVTPLSHACNHPM